MTLFTIDFFELVFLAEACIPPQPIARGAFFECLSEEHYHKMSEAERLSMFKFITKNGSFDLNNEDCRHFYARFNPRNQFLLSCFHEGKGQELIAYRFNEEYHTSKRRLVNSDYIKSVIKLKND